jgi:hypothetical protein
VTSACHRRQDGGLLRFITPGDFEAMGVKLIAGSSRPPNVVD